MPTRPKHFNNVNPALADATTPEKLCLAGFTIEPGSISVAGQACALFHLLATLHALQLLPIIDPSTLPACMPNPWGTNWCHSCMQETCIILPQLKLVLDTGRCPQRAVYQQTVLLSHAHLDHIGGVPFHVSTR